VTTLAGIADPGPQLGSPTQAKRVEKRENGKDDGKNFGFAALD